MGTMVADLSVQGETTDTSMTALEPREPFPPRALFTTSEETLVGRIQVPESYLRGTLGYLIHPREPSLFLWDLLESDQFSMKIHSTRGLSSLLVTVNLST